MVVKIILPYNAILDQPSLYVLDVVVSIKHLLVKFPTRMESGESEEIRPWHSNVIMLGFKSKHNMIHFLW